MHFPKCPHIKTKTSFSHPRQHSLKNGLGKTNSIALKRNLGLTTFCYSKETEMQPSSEVTRLQGSEGLVEYVGAGKLKNKKALITGGE
jgi:hypothetical protein